MSTRARRRRICGGRSGFRPYAPPRTAENSASLPPCRQPAVQDRPRRLSEGFVQKFAQNYEILLTRQSITFHNHLKQSENLDFRHPGKSLLPSAPPISSPPCPRSRTPEPSSADARILVHRLPPFRTRESRFPTCNPQHFRKAFPHFPASSARHFPPFPPMSVPAFPALSENKNRCPDLTARARQGMASAEPRTTNPSLMLDIV